MIAAQMLADLVIGGGLMMVALVVGPPLKDVLTCEVVPSEDLR